MFILQVFDGDSESAAQIANIFDTYNQRYHFEASSNWIYLTFKSDSANVAKGFYFDYE